MGLVESISADPEKEAMELAEQIGQQPPQAIINTKALMKAGNNDAVAAVMKAEFQIFALALQSEEAAEAFMKFMSKKSK
jgi:enoyl-CoA hydratase/carnithine racemase